MSMTRKLPKTDVGRNIALKTADLKKASVAPSELTLTPNTVSRLDIIQPDFSAKMDLRGAALQAQSEATSAKLAAQLKAAMFISHFIQVFNLGVARGIYPASHRAFYKLDVSSNSVPSLTKESEVQYWGEQLITGDVERTAAGGAVMANPSIADVQANYDEFINNNILQSTRKDEYDRAQEAVDLLRIEADKVILKIWDETETFYNEEPIESKRRKCREWGVVYVSTTKSVITGKVINMTTEEPILDATVTLLETGETSTSNLEGLYTLNTTLFGTGTLEFSKDGFIPGTTTVEIPEGGTLILDFKIKPL